MPFSFRPRALPFLPKKLAAAVAVAVALSEASVAQAVGLGNLTVRSALGQPLHAEIELVQTTSQDEGTLVPRLAGHDAFRQASIEFNPVLSSLRFAIEKRGDRRLIRVTSSQPINEPFVDMLLELRGPDGRIMREYVFLLDPPALAQNAPGAQTYGVAASTSEDAAADAKSSTGSVASSATSATAARQQASGKLARPSVASVASLPDPVQALQNPPPAKNLAASEQNSRKKPAAQPATSTQSAATKPRLSLTDVSVAPGSNPVFTAEENAAMEKAVLEANARVKALEQKVEALQQLLAATNGLLTEMHKQSGTAKPALPGGAAGSITTAAATLDPAPRVAAAEVAAAESVKPTDLPLKASVNMTPPTPPAVAVPQPAGLMSDMLFPSLVGGSVLLLGGIAAVALRRRRKESAAGTTDFGAMGTTGHATSSLAPLTESGNSMFMPTFGGAAQQTLSANDPIAEADVYIAYGRDMQAEELLKEALRTRADSTAIRLKLLSIYASRNDKGNFCVLAAELYEMTSGEGDEWQQAVAMGLMIDPLNPLYSMTEKTEKTDQANQIDQLDRVRDQPSAASADTNVMEFDTSDTGFARTASMRNPRNEGAAGVSGAATEPLAGDALMDLDFASSTQPLQSTLDTEAAGENDVKVVEAPAPGTGPIDFDFNPAVPSAAAPIVEFDAQDIPALPAITMPGTAVEVPAVPTSASTSAPGIGPIDFDFQLPDIPAVPGHFEAKNDDELPKLVAVEQPMTSLELDDFLADLTAPGKKDQK